jgi:transposase
MPDRNRNVSPDNFQRIEVITGVGRRRRWSAGDKARIVAESLVPGVSVLEVGRRHGINPNQIYAWRRQFRADGQDRDGGQGAGFAAVVVTESAPAPAVARAGTIEVTVGGMVVRVDGPVDVATLHQVLDTVRRLA